MKRKINSLFIECILLKEQAVSVLSSNSGQGMIDIATSILIAVVLGALVLAGLYALFGEQILPTLADRIEEMFNYSD